jgi:hypothetical protein
VSEYHGQDHRRDGEQRRDGQDRRPGAADPAASRTFVYFSIIHIPLSFHNSSLSLSLIFLSLRSACAPTRRRFPRL